MRAGLIKTDHDSKYLEFVAGLPCCVTGSRPVTVHHLIGHNLRGIGDKTSDYLSIPLSPELHQNDFEALHVIGHKRWEEKFGSQLEHAALTLLQAIQEGFFVHGK